MKQETLEEAAESYSKITLNKSGLMSNKQVNGFIAGAKYQAERMYSEEEVLNILVEHTVELFKGQPCTLANFFEQFKKKA
jgi:cell division protein YceG involved in septum cleavage